MQIKSITKETTLQNGIRVSIDIDIVLNDSVILLEEDTYLDDMLINQVLRSLNESIYKYTISELPNKFIKNQHFIITNKLPTDIKGIFCSIGDEICVDADIISGISEIKSAFLLGHEIGHKIEKYHNVLEIYEDIARILDVSLSGNKYLISETFADECGNIAAKSNYNHGLLRFPLESERREYIHRKILYNLYKG